VSLADIVLIDGEVHTVDNFSSVTQAIAISGNKILATGTTEDILKLRGKSTQVIELNGRSVLPGINDSHAHACAFGASLPPLELDVSFPKSKSISDVREIVKAACIEKGRGELIVGNGWDLGYLAECAGTGRMPTRWDLDDVSPDNPVFLQDFSRHLAWVNTRWLELSGVREGDSVDPDGFVFTDPERGITGLFAEGAQNIVLKALPQMTEARRVAAITASNQAFNQLGITSYTEPGLGPGGFNLMGGAMSSRVLETYIDLVRSQALTTRVNVLWLPCDMAGSSKETAKNLADLVLPTEVDSQRLRVLGGKVFADGIPPNKTAWMKEEYVGGGFGSLCVHGDNDHERSIELTEMIRLIHEAGLQAGVHVTGDAGIDAVIDGFEAAVAGSPRRDSRHYLIHGDFVSKEALRRLGEGGFGVNMNPGIKTAISDLMDEMLGEAKSSEQWPVRSAIEAGVQVCSSSDAPVTKPDWRVAVSAMLLRESQASGKVSGPNERVDLDSALRAYTMAPAWQDFAENWKGSIEPGKVADLCVMGESLRQSDAHSIPEIPIDMTVFDGKVVFDRKA
jgi:predicted amidohydrolase YtcJ